MTRIKKKLIVKLVFNYILPFATAFGILYDSDANMVQRIAVIFLCLTAFEAKFNVEDFPDD